MTRLLRSPLLHFLVLGIALYLAQPWLREDATSTRNFQIKIDAERLIELERGFLQQAGRRPLPEDVDRMIETEADEEILYREAVARGLLERDGGVQTRLIQKMLFLEGETELKDAPGLLARAVELGLHQKDVVVRRILVQKMKLLGSALASAQEPSDEEIERSYRELAESLRSPDRLTLAHTFLNRDERGANLDTQAADLLAMLRNEEIGSKEGPRRGDPFPLGHYLEHRSQHDLERTFGARFGESAFALGMGEWTGPIASAYGAHLIFISERTPGEVPPLTRVANKLRLQLEEQRRDANLNILLAELRTQYRVVVERIPEPIDALYSQEPG
mgnify:FL=1